MSNIEIQYLLKQSFGTESVFIYVLGFLDML